jgi:hypothetical protein
LCVPFPPSPFPLFPAHFSLPLFPARSSQWRLWLTRDPSTAEFVCSLPSFSLPTVPCPLSLFSIMSLPSFPIFDYVPALFPYFWLCPCPLSLFSIISLAIFCPWWSYVTCTNCYKDNLCMKCLSEQNSQIISYAQIVSHPLAPTLIFNAKECLILAWLISWWAPWARRACPHEKGHALLRWGALSWAGARPLWAIFEWAPQGSPRARSHEQGRAPWQINRQLELCFFHDALLLFIYASFIMFYSFLCFIHLFSIQLCSLFTRAHI